MPQHIDRQGFYILLRSGNFFPLASNVRHKHKHKQRCICAIYHQMAEALVYAMLIQLTADLESD
jgi:hypothetical protein